MELFMKYPHEVQEELLTLKKETCQKLTGSCSLTWLRCPKTRGFTKHNDANIDNYLEIFL